MKRCGRGEMISDIKKLIENKFFKKRYITVIDKEDFHRLHKPQKNEHISCKIENASDTKYIEDLIVNICDDADVLKSIKKILINFDNYVLISAGYKGEAAGCIVILIPSEPIIYDSCKYTSDQVHFAQLYVNNKYRRKGISSHLRYTAFEYWYTHYPERTVIGIIERSNDASFQGARKMNYQFGGINYLIKIFGKNIISITNCTGKWELLMLFRGKKIKRV
jgi:hypothetical protein